jgi:mono/diheme cytochrome c family protein
MSATSKKPRLFLKLLFALVIALIFLSIGLAALHKTPWQVPADEKLRKNPLAVSDANYNAAKPIYNEYCSNCHGDSGKGDGSDAMMYDPAPSDLTDASHMNKLSDGEIYYQITQGKKPMPSFRNKLTEEQRWQLVILVRSFSGAIAFPPPPPKTPEPPKPKEPEPPTKH